MRTAPPIWGTERPGRRMDGGARAERESGRSGWYPVLWGTANGRVGGRIAEPERREALAAPAGTR